MRKLLKSLLLSVVAMTAAAMCVHAGYDGYEPITDPLAKVHANEAVLSDLCNDFDRMYSQNSDYFTVYSFKQLQTCYDEYSTVSADNAIRIEQGERGELVYKAPAGGTINDFSIWAYVHKDWSGWDLTFQVSQTGLADSWVNMNARKTSQTFIDPNYDERCYYANFSAAQKGKYKYLKIIFNTWDECRTYEYITEVKMGYTPGNPVELTGTFVDPCNNFDLTYAKSTGMNCWQEGGYFYRDFPYYSYPEYVIYESPAGDITSVSAVDYNNYDGSYVEILVSPDAINWEWVDVARDPDGYQWGVDVTISNANPIPEGMRYVKIVQASYMDEDGGWWQDQLKEVRFTYDVETTVKRIDVDRKLPNTHKQAVNVLEETFGDIELAVNVMNADRDVKLMLLLTEYDANGKLVDVHVSKAVESKKGLESQVKVSFSQQEKAKKLSAYLWDSETLYPVLSSIDI